MRRKASIAGLLLILAAVAAAQDQPRVEDLGWMAGDWRTTLDGHVADRTCFPPAGGSMACMMRVVAEGKVVWLEFSVFRESAAGIVLSTRFFAGDGEPAPPVSNNLRLRSAAGGVWTFEDPQGRQPRTETITRTGTNAMAAHADLIDSQGRASAIDTRWERVR